MKIIKYILILFTVAISFSSNASTYTTNFSNASGAYYFDGHQASQTFTSTGLTEVNQLQLTLNLDYIAVTETLGLSFYLNNEFIGSTDFLSTERDLLDPVRNLDFSFASIFNDIGEWNLLMAVSNPVSSGAGSIKFFNNNPLTLSDVSTVPVPAAAWLFGSALLGFFGFSRKKANA